MSSKTPIRILRIIARLNVGGPAIQAVNLTRQLSTGPYESLLVCGRVSPHEGDMLYLARNQGVRPVIIPELGREISPVNDLKALLALRRIIRDFRPHIIHTHTAKAGALGRLAALLSGLTLSRKGGARMVHTFHGHVFHSYFGSRKTALFLHVERFLARFTERIIVISSLQKRDICLRYRIADEKRVALIPLGFDLSGFEECERHHGLVRGKFVKAESREKVVVGIIGRLTPVKDHHILLDAVKLLKERGKADAFRFLIVGDGELREELVERTKAMGLDEIVHFLGWQRDMPKVYGALDAVVLTSRNEGTPVTLIEAMAAGRPVVATDVGGVRDLMGNVGERSPLGFQPAENGIIVSSGDPMALANALLFLTENREVSAGMATSARNFVLRQYSLERLVDDIKCLYGDILNTSIS
jgi:glycosyltransferase involved in cell wall biosynthesis